jgi:hypothetical protein
MGELAIKARSYSERNPDKFGKAVVLGFVAAGVVLTTFATEADAETHFYSEYLDEGKCLESLGYTSEVGAYPHRKLGDERIIEVTTDSGKLPGLEFTIERTPYFTIDGFSPANGAARLAVQACDSSSY